jgi:hypothetical protein
MIEPPPGGPQQEPFGQQLPYGGYLPSDALQYPYGPPPRRRHWVRNVFIGLGAIIAFIIVVAVITASVTSPKNPSSAATIGGTFKVTGSNDNIYSITLLKVIDPARGTGAFDEPDNGTHFVAAVFRITGVSGASSDDSDIDASVTGSNQQVYGSVFDTIVGYTNFNAGQFNVSSGQSQTGAVTFQVPNGVKVSNVQWSVGLDSSTATWNLG